jgi:hypothetical protein
MIVSAHGQMTTSSGSCSQDAVVIVGATVGIAKGATIGCGITVFFADLEKE